MAALPDYDRASGCYVSGHRILRHGDNAEVSSHDNHTEAVRAYCNTEALAARLAELDLADRIEREIQQRPGPQGPRRWKSVEDESA